MRGPRFETRVSGRLLLLLLLLLSGLTRTEAELQEDAEEAQAEEEAAEGEEEATDPSEDVTETTPIPTVTPATNAEEEGEHGSGRSLNNGAAPAEDTVEPDFDADVTASPEEEEGLDLLFIVIPVVLVVLIITIIVCCIFINRRINRNTTHSEVSKEDPFLDGSSTEKVPMPMFEEDVPSVLELEMTDLDDWIKKDGTLSDHNQNA